MSNAEMASSNQPNERSQPLMEGMRGRMTAVTQRGDRWHLLLEFIHRGKDGSLKGNISAFKENDLDYIEETVQLPEAILLQRDEAEQKDHLRLVGDQEPEAYQAGHEHRAIHAREIVALMGVTAISCAVAFEYHRQHKR